MNTAVQHGSEVRKTVQDNYYICMGWRPWMSVEMAIGFLTANVEVDSE